MKAEVARDMGALSDVMRLVEQFFADSRIDQEARFPVELAVEEVFTNMVRHNAGGRSRIEVALGVRDGEIVVTLTDFDAPRFDPTADAPPVDTSAPLAERTAGGLGIHLVRKMMDRIEYSHHNRTGTITLRKRVG